MSGAFTPEEGAHRIFIFKGLCILRKQLMLKRQNTYGIAQLVHGWSDTLKDHTHDGYLTAPGWG